MNSIFLTQLAEAIRKVPRKMTLVAVTKSVEIDETNEIIKAGVGAIGENRIEDFIRKLPTLLPIEKHFIGQIQSRKIKRIVELFDVIQSVGSIEHLEKIEKEALTQRKLVKVLLQFNISGEKQRAGFRPEELGDIAAAIQHSLSANSCELADKSKNSSTAHHAQIIGVMGMASQTDDEAIVRKQFRLLKDIRDRLHVEFPEITELSMGMSDDYKIALEEGATILRIGRLLFSDTI